MNAKKKETAKNVTKDKSRPKTKCPLTAAEFKEQAKPMTVRISDQEQIAYPKEFSTGSFGWWLGEKVILQVGDTPVKVQATISLVAVGSKPVV